MLVFVILGWKPFWSTLWANVCKKLDSDHGPLSVQESLDEIQKTVRDNVILMHMCFTSLSWCRWVGCSNDGSSVRRKNPWNCLVASAWRGFDCQGDRDKVIQMHMRLTSLSWCWSIVCRPKIALQSYTTTNQVHTHIHTYIHESVPLPCSAAGGATTSLKCTCVSHLCHDVDEWTIEHWFVEQLHT